MNQSGLVARNMLASLASQSISWALTFAVMIFLPRYVGDAGLGKLAVAASYAGIFSVIAPLGTGAVLIKAIARDRSRTGALLSAALALRIPVSLVLSLVAIEGARLCGYSPLLQTLIFCAVLAMTLGTVNTAFSAALQGQEKISLSSLVFLVERFLTSLLTIALIFHKAPLWQFAAIGLIANFVSLFVNLIACRSLLPTLRLPDFSSVIGLAAAGLPFMGWVVFSTLYGQTDPIVMKLFTNDAAIGWYAAAQRMVGMTLFFPSAITAALMPTLSRLYKEDPDAYRRLGQRMMASVMLCSIPFALLLICMPEALLGLMHYPAGFGHSVPVIRIGGIGVLMWSAACVLGTMMVTSECQHKMLRTSILATFIGIPACFLGTWLTQRFYSNGAIGAMASDIGLEVLLIFLYFRILPARTYSVASGALILRCLIASVPMALLMWIAARSQVGLWAVAPCFGVYAALCRALGCLGPLEIAMLREIVSKKRHDGK